MAVSAAQMVASAQTHANMQVNGPYSPAEWQTFVDRAVEALWHCIVDKQPTFRVTSATLTIASSSVPSQPLPSDFLSVLTVVKDAGTSNRQQIPRYADQFAAGPFSRTFRIEGSTFFVDPQEQAAGSYQLRYVPRVVVPVVNIDAELEQFREFVELHAAIAALDGEESNTAALNVRLYGSDNQGGVKARVESWAARQRSAEPSRVRDVRGRGNFIGPRNRWSIP